MEFYSFSIKENYFLINILFLFFSNNTDTGVADSFNQSHAVVTNAVSFSTNSSVRMVTLD